jgi:hypothetical protein
MMTNPIGQSRPAAPQYQTSSVRYLAEEGALKVANALEKFRPNAEKGAVKLAGIAEGVTEQISNLNTTVNNAVDEKVYAPLGVKSTVQSVRQTINTGISTTGEMMKSAASSILGIF